MWRHGDWATGENIRVSNATLKAELSLKTVRGIQINVGTLIAMKILVPQGARRVARWRHGGKVVTARRGGIRSDGSGRVNEFDIDWDALPAPVSTVATVSADDQPLLWPKDDPGFAEGRSGDRLKDDPEIIQPSPPRPESRQRTATADAAAFPQLGPFKTMAPIDRGRIRMSASTKRRLTREPRRNGNYEVLQKLAWTVLHEPRRQLRYIQELVQTESGLVAAVKEFAARKRITRQGDELERACASVWVKFTIPGIVAGTEARLRDRARRRRATSGRRG